MVDRATAAALLQISISTYGRYAKKGILPKLNQIGRVSVAALERCARTLDGLPDENVDLSDVALNEWKQRRGRH